MKFVIITGMSGAGKSLAIRYMEDIGFFCIDNLPPVLINKFVELCIVGKDKFKKIALVVDIRGGNMLDDLLPCLNVLKELGIEYEIVFLDASDDTLIKRYKGTRRMHPLSTNGMLIDGIKEERKRLEPIKSKAYRVIDTSNLTSKHLKDKINAMFDVDGEENGIMINIISFGYKYGLPVECDLVFDLRFIPNPYYIEELRPLSGKDEEVRNFVLSTSIAKEFLSKFTDMLEFLLPNYKNEGKSQIVIGIGCTGGRHRSVAIAQKIYNILKSKGRRIVIEHRDIEKDTKMKR